MDRRAIEIHINLARHDNGIVDRIGAMVAWRNTRAKADDPEYCSVGNCGADFLA
jgi:hypothetical protein